MSMLNTPVSYMHDFVVEVMHNNNPQTTSSYHYETFMKARDHYERIRENEAFVSLSAIMTVNRNGAEDFKKWVLAKNK